MLFESCDFFLHAQLLWTTSASTSTMTSSSSHDDATSSGDIGKRTTTTTTKPLYDVYGREIDPRNVMPLNPNQIAHPDQKRKLPVEREVSSIPKGEGETWQYPSEQMFYNALKRKGKGDDVDEELVSTILKIHNNMNEQTWEKVVDWEKLHIGECNEYPVLTRFMGRPHDLSPRAWLAHHVLGKEKPFDRHDWFVSRCGKEVRYVIDYYHDESKSPFDELPKHKKDKEAIKSIAVQVRPALDSVGAAVDRAVRMPAHRHFGMFSGGGKEWVPSSVSSSSSARGGGGEQCPVDHGKVASAPLPPAGDVCPVDHGRAKTGSPAPPPRPLKRTSSPASPRL